MILLGFVPPCQPSLYTGLAAAPKTPREKSPRRRWTKTAQLYGGPQSVRCFNCCSGHGNESYGRYQG